MKTSIKFLIILLNCILIACTDSHEAVNSKNEIHGSDSSLKNTEQETGQMENDFSEFAFIANSRYLIISSTPDSTWSTGAPKMAESENSSNANYHYASVTGVKNELLPEGYSRL